MEIDPSECIQKTDLNAIIDGTPHPGDETEIGLEEIAKETRMQTVIFKLAAQFYGSTPMPDWKSGEGAFLAQLVSLVKQLIDTEKVRIKSDPWNLDETQKKIVLILSINKIITHFWPEIQKKNTERLIPVFDTERPVSSTAYMPVWYTSKPHRWSEKSHINYSVFDSGWENTADGRLDRSPDVHSFFKNDHHGLSVYYTDRGVVRRYIPDFIVKLANRKFLILEIKGQDSPQVRAKKDALDEWVQAVNEHGGFGTWHSEIAFQPADVPDIIAAAAAVPNRASEDEKPQG